jgi:uncharacterized protein
MAEERERFYVTPAKFANPAPLGLAGFALTTFVLNVHNAGMIDIGAALPLGLFYGGLAQLVAGFLEFRTGNTFGMTAFGSYGAFWMALASMVIMQMNKWIPADASKGWLLTTLVAWTIFTAVLLDVSVYTGSKRLTHISGYEGIFCALTAWYLMAAIILNEAFGRVILPVGPLERKEPPAAPKVIAKASA